MWFRMPAGTNGVTIELREFEAEAEAKAEDGKVYKYFRAPDYLAPKIVALPGFLTMAPPDGATMLSDLPETDAEQDELTGGLTKKLAEVTQERDELKALLHDAQLLVKQSDQKVRDAERYSAELQNKVDKLEKDAEKTADSKDKK